MERLKGEILDLKMDISHRSSLRIHSILHSNSQLFSETLDPDYFQLILKNFEALSNMSLKDSTTPHYKDEYKKNFENLSFHLNRV
ncbi:MAG: hypothetical protein PSX36_02125 [bacterium]|nr:hypothetical protein [bacterium]